jgi:hypothetical protein
MNTTSEALRDKAAGIAKANGISLQLAIDYAAKLGDSPEKGLDGRVAVRDDENRIIARVFLPEARV